MTLRTTGPIFGDQWPVGLLTYQTNEAIFGPMTLRTTDLSNYCMIFEPMKFRTSDHSEYRAVPGTKGAESDATCWHISAHVGTYQHMSACPHVLTHTRIKIRSKWLVSEVPRMMLHIGTRRYMSAHVGTYQPMPVCPYVLTYLRMQISRLVA